MCENHNCEICDCIIENGSEQYSFALMEEFFDHDAFEVNRAQNIITTCIKCQEKFNLDTEIDKSLDKFFEAYPAILKKQNKVTPIHSHYDCQKCNTPIRDGDILFSINHFREIWNNGYIEPVNERMAYHLCLPCTNETGILTSVIKIVNEIIAKAKRINFFIPAKKSYLKTNDSVKDQSKFRLH